MKLISATLSAIALSLICATSLAGSMTVMDPNSDFSVTYNPGEAGLFGTLVLSHNTIFFLPDNFSAEALGPNSSAFAIETLQLRLDATTPGFSFDNFLMQEEGDYMVNGVDTLVSVTGEMRVRSIDDMMTTYTNGFQFNDVGDQGTALPDWQGSAVIDATTGWTGTDSGTVFLTLQNNLSAQVGADGTRAFISKKSAGVSIAINPIPVPAAVWLFGSGLLALFGYRKTAA